MILLPDWKRIAKKAWSARLMYAAAFLSGLESVAAIAGESIAKRLPVGLYAALVGVITGLAILSRFVAQKDLHDG